MEILCKPVAHIRTDFPEKFGIPRQSGLVPSLRGRIIFEPEYRSMDAIRGIEEYSRLWLIWGFSQAHQKNQSLTVAPPRLGGKERRGVFATRSPFRPNKLGLSCVRLEAIVSDGQGAPMLEVSGIDLLDGTPIYDIKPYLPYADAFPEESGSFGQEHHQDKILVEFSPKLLERIEPADRQSILDVLAQDPRAAYNKKPDYVYGMRFGKYDIRFVVGETGLVVQDVLVVQGKFEKIK